MNRAPDDPAGHLAWARCNLCGYEPQRCLTVSAAKLSPPWPIHGGHLGMVTWGWGSQEKKKRESIIRHLNMLVGLKGTSGEREIEYIVEGAVNWLVSGRKRVAFLLCTLASHSPGTLCVWFTHLSRRPSWQTSPLRWASSASGVSSPESQAADNQVFETM